MFGKGFDYFVAAVCLVLAVVFLMGKGRGILDGFGGAQKQRKRTPEEERKYEFGYAIFCLIMAGGQLLVGFVDAPWTGIAGLVIAIADLVFIGWYASTHQ